MNREIIGPKIKEFRKKRKITQDELAESLGYSGKSVISHIEKGDADMTYEKILLLLRTYMLDANELFEVDKIDRQLDEWKLEKRKNKKIAVSIHGLYGSANEAENYSYLKDEYDVVGLDYVDGNPWELKDVIRNKFEKLSKNYEEILVIANSIGAFYAYEYLSDYKISRAFFISPIADMAQIIFNKMMKEGISNKELEEKKYMTCKDGTVLSFDFYHYISNHKDDWKVPTDILYGGQDQIVYLENIADFLASHPQSKLTIKRDSEHYFYTEKEKDFIKNWILNSLTLR